MGDAGQLSRIVGSLVGIGALLLALGCTRESGGNPGTGGAGGLGGTGGVAPKLGWCATEPIDLGETESPTEISAAADRDGNVVVVWEDEGPDEVWSNHWTPEAAWGAAVRIQSDAGPTSLPPRLTVDASGAVVALWAQSDCVSEYPILSNRWTEPEGWSQPQRIDAEGTRVWRSALASSASGIVVAVWVQYDGETGYTVYSNRWTEVGGWGSPEQIQSSLDRPTEVQVVLAENGNAIAAWSAEDGEQIDALWLSRWTPADGWSTPERAPATGAIGDFAIALAASGEAIALWSSASLGTLWWASWNGVWGPAAHVVATFANRPVVKVDDRGNAMAVWSGGTTVRAGRWTADEGWYDVTELRGSVDSVDCEEVEGPCVERQAYTPQLAIDRSGDAAVVWQEREYDGERWHSEIWARRWTYAEGWLDAELVARTDRRRGSPQIVFDATGTAVAVWLDGQTLRSSRFELGCGDDGSRGAGGAGGGAGSGGAGGGNEDPCTDVVCPDTECKSGGACDAGSGACVYSAVADDGTACSQGACLEGGCGQAGAWACSVQGLQDAIAAGGGPHFFACDEETPIVLTDPIVIDNDVILDGEGELVLQGALSPGAMQLERGNSAELRAIRALTGSIGIVYFAVRNYGGSLIISDSLVEGVYNTTDASTTVIDSELRRFGVDNNRGEVTVIRTLISAAESFERGGAIDNSGGVVTVRDSTITGSGNLEWSLGGAAYNSHLFGLGEFHQGVLVIENSTISGNTGRYAGAIYNNGEVVTVINSTISGNTAERGPSIHSWTWRGGSVAIINSTISGSAVDYECGSEANGYAIGNTGDLTLTNSTLAGNAFGALDNRGNATVTSSVLDGGCAQFGDDSALMSGGYNIVGGSDACGFEEPTDMVEVSSAALALGPLADNGGATMTHALLSGSVAIDAIPALMCQVTEDQRGEPRPAGGMCDVGAFEVQP